MSNFNNDYSIKTKKMSNILFRADSSSDIGTGHIMRDLVLASQYKNDNIIFVVQDLKGNINHKILEAGYTVEILKNNDIKEFDDIVQKYSANLVIIDSYDINYKFEKELKNSNSKMTLMVLDDTYEKHYCDILLNHNISADKKRYKELVPKSCELRCGSKYTLLRDEFIIEKKIKKQDSKIIVFVSMGGSDPYSINKKVLQVLENFENIKVNLVTTTSNKNLKYLKQFVKYNKWIKLHVNSKKIAKLMNNSDFAIATPSVTINEICFMEVPFIAIKTADNQEDIYQYLKNKNLLVLNEFNKQKLIKKIKKVLFIVKTKRRLSTCF